MTDREQTRRDAERWVVMVRGVDDSFTAYGVVTSQGRAELAARQFNERIEKHEASHPDEPDGIAWAYAMPLNRMVPAAAMVKTAGVS